MEIHYSSLNDVCWLVSPFIICNFNLRHFNPEWFSIGSSLRLSSSNVDARVRLCVVTLDCLLVLSLCTIEYNTRIAFDISLFPELKNAQKTMRQNIDGGQYFWVKALLKVRPDTVSSAWPPLISAWHQNEKKSFFLFRTWFVMVPTNKLVCTTWLLWTLRTSRRFTLYLHCNGLREQCLAYLGWPFNVEKANSETCETSCSS